MSGLGKVDNRICMVLKWTLGLKRLAYSRIDLLCCSVSLHLKGTWETQNHQAFCVSCACIIHTNLQSCMSTDSKLPVTGYLRTKGQESMYETCACVIHTILLSYMCINNYCQSFHINVCAGYMCFVKL